MSKSNRRVRRSFTADYKAQAVELVRAGGKSAGQVARDLDLAGSALRDWVKQADDAARTGKLVDEDERAELKRLREEVRELRMQRDFLKKAAAFFAKESK
jgi:transposase